MHVGPIPSLDRRSGRPGQEPKLTMTELKQKANFQCLRCRHEYEDSYSPGEIRERTCPGCGSNSVRRVRKVPSPSRPADKERG